MRYIPDKTGRFRERPFYEIDELNSLCEQIISSFLAKHRGHVRYPVETDDLTILIENYVSDLDQFADLSNEGFDVEGITEFLTGDRPRVQISEQLHRGNRENRLRSTLTHELGHVVLHDRLWPRYQLSLFDQQDKKEREPLPHCKRETIVGAAHVDWLEWQAGFASGAFLMPITPLQSIVRVVHGNSRATVASTASSVAGQNLIHQVEEAFQVSADAARVRLLQLNYLTDSPTASLLR